MIDKLAKLASILLCSMMIADLSAVISVNMYEETSPNPLAGSSKTIWVDDDFVDDPSNHKWDTIQEGVDDADSGDSVYVFNGSYYEHVVINRTINLTGEDWRSTIIDGRGIIPEVVWIRADGVYVRGFTVTNGGGVDCHHDAGIVISTNYNTVSSNNVSSNPYSGIIVGGKHNTVLGNNISSNDIGVWVTGKYNTISGNTISWNEHFGIGFHFHTHYNIITKNNISRNGYFGITQGHFSKNSTISDNIISWNRYQGIQLYRTKSNTIVNNTISHNRGWGIDFYTDADHNTVSGNNIISNRGGIGLYDSSCNNTISGNNISLTRHNGILLGDSNDNTVSNNTISLSGLYDHGIRILDGIDNLIYHNNLIDNPNQALDTNPANNDWHHPTLLEGNYWSDYTGLDDGSGTGKHAIAGDGIGDTLIPHPGTDYDFYPFVKEGGWIPENIPPVADAGSDQTVYVGDVVQFDGSGSFDPDAMWQKTTVDSYGRVGRYTSLALDSNDNPHISYHDWNNRSLKYAKWTGSSWSIETVDKNGTRGWDTSIALDDRGYPHISYHNYTNHNLTYARWNGSAWIVESVDGNSWNPSMALDSHGNPHISYVNGTDADLKYAKWNGTAWIIETVDYPGRVGSVGSYSSLALDGNDNPHISYQNWTSTTDTQLKYAKWNGSAWNIEVVESGGGSLRARTSLALDSNNNPHISYCEWFNWSGPERNCYIKYARWNGSAWNIETVDFAGDVGGRNSIALDSNDNPHVSYSESIDDDTLKYARRTKDSWNIETVDLNLLVGSLSLALDTNDNPHVSYSDLTNEDLKYAKKGGGIVSYDWDFGNGSPHGVGVRPTHVYSIPGTYIVTLTVTDQQGATDTDNCIINVLSKNQPPVADANGPYNVDEGSPVILDGSGSYDSDGDALQYRWDLDDDGIWDTGWSSSPYLEHTWGDDYSGKVVLEVWDGELSDTDTATVTVFNVAPTAELRILPIDVNVSLRIAGEKWHDVSIELYENGILIAQGNLTRYPGSPNDQMLDLTYLSVNISRKYSLVVRYTPEDDPVNGQPNGANPCWIILTFDDGEELRLHHNFNFNHPDRYVWEVDLVSAILSHGLTFEATAYDPGADDLAFHWSFGDGTNATSFYPNTNNTYPVQITETITHAFLSSGSFTVTLTVTDDDGGVGVATINIVIP